MMLRRVVCLAALAALLAVRADGALVTNFAASYAQYAACVGSSADFDSDLDIDAIDFLMWQRGMGSSGLFIANLGDANRDGFVGAPDFSLWKSQLGGTAPIADSACFKLFFDPQGIVNGTVTVVIDAPTASPGQTRFPLSGGDFGIADAHPAYIVSAGQPTVSTTPTGQRLTAKVSFIARNPSNPPLEPITLFGYQASDGLPSLGLGGVQASFQFVGDDFIRVRESTTGVFTLFDETQLDDVFLPFIGTATLEINQATGTARIANRSATPIELSQYEISTPSGRLNLAGWLSLADQGQNFDEDPGASAFRIGELHAGGAAPLQPGQVFELGGIFNTGGPPPRDVRFVYTALDHALAPGIVNYDPPPIMAVPEPHAGLLLAGAALAACGHARRRR